MEIIKEKRRSIAFSFSEDGEFLVRAPIFLNDQKILEILSQNKAKIEKMKKREEAFRKAVSTYSEGELLEKGKRKIEERLGFWEEKMGLFPKSVKITSAKGRFGSCSSKGNICFSKYLFMRSDEEIDYVFVHELAHLKEMNHSDRFYKIIASVMPDYKIYKAALKKSNFSEGGEDN